MREELCGGIISNLGIIRSVTVSQPAFKKMLPMVFYLLTPAFLLLSPYILPI